MTTNGILTIRQRNATTRVPVIDGDTLAVIERDSGKTVIEIDVRLTEGELRNRIVQAEQPVPWDEPEQGRAPGFLARLAGRLR